MSSFIAWLFGGGLGVSVVRIRNAWLVGFVWSVLSFIGAVGGIWGLSSDSSEGLSLLFFVLVVLEVGLVSFLSYGVLRKSRFSSLALFFYFCLSRVLWILVGFVGMFSLGDFARFVVFHLLPAYLFFQGMRGVWSYYYRTHPVYVVESST